MYYSMILSGCYYKSSYSFNNKLFKFKEHQNIIFYSYTYLEKKDILSLEKNKSIIQCYWVDVITSSPKS